MSWLHSPRCQAGCLAQSGSSHPCIDEWGNGPSRFCSPSDSLLDTVWAHGLSDFSSKTSCCESLPLQNSLYLLHPGGRDFFSHLLLSNAAFSFIHVCCHSSSCQTELSKPEEFLRTWTGCYRGGSLLMVPNECFHMSWTAPFFKARCLTACIKLLVF